MPGPSATNPTDGSDALANGSASIIAPNQSASDFEASAVPLVVDLDQTLVTTDTLWESVLKLVREQGLVSLLPAVSALRRGREAFKSFLADRVMPDPALLPYHPGVIAQVRAARDAGRPVWLVSAADQRIVHAVASHLGLFDQALGSTRQTNLKGGAKLEAIKALAGDRGYEYIGDHRADLPIWREAVANHAVFARGKAPGWVGDLSFSTTHARPGSTLDSLRALRPHQWVKNVLVLLALFFSHQAADLSLWPAAISAFVSFCFGASAVYLVNDLLDLEADRAHRTKRRRPLASGRLAIPTALALAAGLTVGSLALALLVTPTLMWIVVLYLVVTTLYSVDLKRRLLVDVLTLAGLYTLRLVAGGVAVGVEVSPWLMSFSVFFFLGLALNKRYVELKAAERSGAEKTAGRNYSPEDLPMVGIAGLASGYLAVLVFTLYIVMSPMAARLYERPGVLWLVEPLLIYWITRLWFIAHRGALDDDPVLFALKDRVSWAVAAGVALLLLLAA
ncbi:MAG: UbiA family prenyltransferase [Planctomycetota bacterium]